MGVNEGTRVGVKVGVGSGVVVGSLVGVGVAILVAGDSNTGTVESEVSRSLSRKFLARRL